jgi:hypothetical protein
MLLAAIAVTLGLVAALAAAEVALRLTGHAPWRYATIDPRIPVVNDPDPILSWQPKPGAYLIPPFRAGAQPTRLTIQADRSRATGSPGDRARKLLLVGCSFTFGWGVSDEDTFAWKLHDKLPGYDVINHGVVGYGTYQSLLLLERLLAEGPAPNRVVYGYLEGHEGRNVAHPLWTFGLTKYSRQGMVAVPFCTLDGDGHLRRRSPERYPEWPLHAQLAVVNFLEQSYMKLELPERTAQGRPVTDLLLLQMADLCRQHHIEFAVVFLSAGDEARDHYARFLRDHGIETINCSHPLTADVVVAGDGHPNPRLHAYWADCIAAALAPEE